MVLVMTFAHIAEIAILTAGVIIALLTWGIVSLSHRRGGLFRTYFTTDGTRFRHGYPSLHTGGYRDAPWYRATPLHTSRHRANAATAGAGTRVGRGQPA
jgi:hypothetical protein